MNAIAGDLSKLKELVGVIDSWHGVVLCILSLEYIEKRACVRDRKVIEVCNAEVLYIPQKDWTPRTIDMAYLGRLETLERALLRFIII